MPVLLDPFPATMSSSPATSGAASTTASSVAAIPKPKVLGPHGSMIGGPGNPTTVHSTSPERTTPLDPLPLSWWAYPHAQLRILPPGGQPAALAYLAGAHLAGVLNRPGGRRLARMFRSTDLSAADRAILAHLFGAVTAPASSAFAPSAESRYTKWPAPSTPPAPGAPPSSGGSTASLCAPFLTHPWGHRGGGHITVPERSALYSPHHLVAFSGAMYRQHPGRRAADREVPGPGICIDIRHPHPVGNPDICAGSGVPQRGYLMPRKRPQIRPPLQDPRFTWGEIRLQSTEFLQ